MTLIASLLFLSALVAAVIAIAATVGNAMPRILQVIENEFIPEVRTERRISFGQVKQRQLQRSADVVAFPRTARDEKGFKLAA